MTVTATTDPDTFLRAPLRRDLVRVLDADPDLAAALDPAERQAAAEATFAAAFRHPRGPWTFAPAPDTGSLGVLILEGLILVRIEIGRRAHVDLLGQGDIISPWVGVGPELGLPTVASACIVEDVRLALLDRRFAMRAARWPEIAGSVMHRLITRSRRLSLQAAINGIPRIDERLELTLWLLAYRFGRVTPGGLRLRLGLTHLQLADILASQRPSVTVALSRLEDGGALARPSKHEWLLRGPEPEAFADLARQSGLRR